MHNSRSRKSSLGRSMSFSQRNMTIGKISDRRNVKDPQVQAVIRNDLQTFFFEQQVDFFSVRCLTNPLRQDFENMLRYILLCMDPYLVFSASSNIFLAEAYDMVKRTYPFQVSKTHFDSAGAKHSWPILLGMLHFLMKLAMEKAEIGLSFEADEGRFDIDDQCYNLYMDSSGNELDEKTSELIDHEEKKIEMYEQFYDQSQEEIGETEKEIDKYHQITKDTLEELQAAKEFEVQTDLFEAKFNSAKSTMRSEETILIELEKKIKTLIKKEDDLKKQVAQQPLSKGSAKKIVQTSRQLKHKLESFEKEVLLAKKAFDEKLTKMNNRQDLLEAKMEGLTSLINSNAAIFSPLEQYLNKESLSLEEFDGRWKDKQTLITTYKSISLTKEKIEFEDEINKLELELQTLLDEKLSPGKLESNSKRDKLISNKQDKLNRVRQELKQHKADNKAMTKQCGTFEEDQKRLLAQKQDAAQQAIQENESVEVEANELADKLDQLHVEYDDILSKCKEEYLQIQKDIEAEKQRRLSLKALKDDTFAHIKSQIEMFTED